MCSTTRRRAARLGASVATGLPLIAGHVEVGTQRPPHLARIQAVLDGLRGGTPTQGGQHMVHEQRGAPNPAELRLDEFMEFRRPHATNLPSGLQRFMAHPYRIGDVGDASARLHRRLQVSR